MDEMPKRVSPMLAVSGSPFDSDEFAFEIKWDGIRAIAFLDHSHLWIESRNFKPLLPRFPELTGIKDRLEVKQAIVDGEIVVFGPDGKPDFDAVRARNAQKDPIRIADRMRRHPAVFVAFDCLFVDGKSLMSQPLSQRLERLNDILSEGGHLQKSRPVPCQGTAFFEAIKQKSLEGMVAKRLSSPYQPGVRSPHWIKVRNVKQVDCVIGGWIPKEKHRIKSLLLGLYDWKKNLEYIGSVGTGFSADDESALLAVLRPLRRMTSPFNAVAQSIAHSAQWVEPKVVCTVEYLTLTREGHLRHPVFRGLRTDQDAGRCLLDSEYDQVR